MDKQLLELYARFAVKCGSNVQKGQTLIIDSPIETAFFAQMCAAEAFAVGAKDVVVHYADEKLARIRMQLADEAVLEDVKPWALSRYMEYAKPESDVCRLVILAQDPEIFKGLDTAKVDKATKARMRAMMPWREMVMANRMQWSIVSVPSVAWAKKVFADKNEQDAVQALWDAIFKVCRVDTGDPEAAWQAHVAQAQSRAAKLNDMGLTALHLRGENGTDLMVGLADDYRFKGLQSLRTPDGLPFLPNIPSEELFTAPHCKKVDGIVKSSMPYVFNGNLIEGITARFEKGVAVEVTAEKGQDLLEQMMAADEGARRLGEIALVPASSPVRQTGLLFYNTLFDENASCHMAFGAAYPNSIKDGSKLSASKQSKKGLNQSIIHEDVMIGTPKMDIDGILPDGSMVPIFREGEWVL